MGWEKKVPSLFLWSSWYIGEKEKIGSPFPHKIYTPKMWSTTIPFFTSGNREQEGTLLLFPFLCLFFSRGGKVEDFLTRSLSLPVTKEVISINLFPLINRTHTALSRKNISFFYSASSFSLLLPPGCVCLCAIGYLCLPSSSSSSSTFPNAISENERERERERESLAN